jgi:DNA-binding MarR family transcriptional regulator
MAKIFEIQLPTEIIRNSEVRHDTFYVFAKLIQHYYMQQVKNCTLHIDHKKFMFYANIKSNQTFKRCMNELCELGLVKGKVKKLPRHGLIEIELNSIYVKNGKDYYFAALPYYFLDKHMLDVMGYEGYRLMYYFRSHISSYDKFCFSSQEKIAEVIGSSPNTVDKYCKILKKMKLIRIIKHEVGSTGEFEIVKGEEREVYTRYNNHYYIRADKFETIHAKLKES